MVTAEARAPRWPDAIYFRVKTIFHPRTKQYVMWVNAVPRNATVPLPECPVQAPNTAWACYFVGTSSAPEGPFVYRGASTTRYPGPADFDLLVEGDDAYIMYGLPTVQFGFVVLHHHPG
jgi:hypothetical protein